MDIGKLYDILEKDKTSRFGEVPGDITGILMYYVLDSIIKIKTVEEIKIYCTQNDFFKYNICNNVKFWELVWLKNVSDILPDPKVLYKKIKIAEKKYLLNSPDILINMKKIIKKYIKDDDKLEYMKNLYECIYRLYNTSYIIVNEGLGFDILNTKIRLSANFLNNFMTYAEHDNLNKYLEDNKKYNYERDMDLNYNNIMNYWIILSYAVSKNNENMFEYLVNKGLNINKLYETPIGSKFFKKLTLLGLAIIQTYDIGIRYLLKNGADTNIVGIDNQGININALEIIDYAHNINPDIVNEIKKYSK